MAAKDRPCSPNCGGCELGRAAAHPHPGFWLSAFFLDFAFTATSFFAGAEKRK
jgi:hypothetical protein